MLSHTERPECRGARGSSRRRERPGQAAHATSGPWRLRPRVCHCVGRILWGFRVLFSCCLFSVYFSVLKGILKIQKSGHLLMRRVLLK